MKIIIPLKSFEFYIKKMLNTFKLFNKSYFKNLQAQFDASELITNREVVSQRVSEELTERASTFGLLLDDISLVS